MARGGARDVKQVLDNVAAQLRRILEDRWLGFAPEPAEGQSAYELSGHARGQAFDGEGRSYTVLPLLEDRSGARYWVAVRVNFKWPKGIAEIRDVQIVVFHGTADPGKEAVFRAEWHDWDDQHAQPHWHIYRTRQDAIDLDAGGVTEIVLEDAGGDGETLAPNAIPVRGLDDFHFAMCSSWASGAERPDGHRNAIQSDAVQIWIRQCLAYCKAQLEYLRG